MSHTHEKIVVKRIEAEDAGIVAGVLAEAFAEDPVFIWALPKAATRVANAAAFFTFYLRRSHSAQREMYATSDYSAVAVMTTVSEPVRKPPAAAGGRPTLLGSSSPAGDYFRWIDTFRPEVPHRFLEFIGSSADRRAKGQGSVLLKSLLTAAARDGLPVWTWSSNPRNLPFYHRLDFEEGAELCRDADTPAVTPLLRPPILLAP